MFELFRNCTTLQTAPRVGIFLWSVHRLPLVPTFGSLVLWLTAIGVGLIVASVGLDWWMISRSLKEQRASRYWADLRARHSREQDFPVDDDLF